MSIKLNTNNTDITVYDKVNIKHATGKEVVPLTTVVRGSILNNLVSIVSHSLNLSNSEHELYDFITAYSWSVRQTYPNDDMYDVNSIVNRCASFNNKHYLTYKRAIEVLVIKGVLKYHNSHTVISIVSCYDFTTVNEVAKYIVIEVNRPKVVHSVNL